MVTANMCGPHCQNIYGMTTLKLLNIATLFSCSWENGITPYFVRKMIQWMNLYVPATHLRVVGAESVHVLASLKKDTKKKTMCRSSNKKAQSASPIDKCPQTLESSRKERFGIGNKSTKFDAEKYGRGK